MKQQLMKIFWDHTRDRRNPSLPEPPTEGQVRASLAENNQTCPLNDIIIGDENEGNMRTLRRFAFTACKRYNHSARGCNFGIFAQSGQGKTYVVKQFAETIGIPFVLIQSASLSDTWQLFREISEACEKAGTPVVDYKTDNSDYTFPPVMVLFDEAHQLPKKMMKGGLLNAMEPDDGYMLAKPPGMRTDSIVIDCKDVCWIAATTEKGMLFDAFSNRLGTYIEWRNAGTAQVAQIIQQKMDWRAKHKILPFSMPIDACEIVARYCRVPREAVNFATKVVQQRDMMPADSWLEAAEQVAADIGLDEWGFTGKQIAILTACGQRPIALKSLPTVARCRIEQVEKYELPKLIGYYDGGPFLVPVSGRGMCITEAGIAELEKRSIDHKGNRITAEHFEKRR
jgi:Holliday junction resolvasome RuvABC ATP-dependent DNA helicase subunit